MGDFSVIINVPSSLEQPILMQSLTVAKNVDPFFVNSTDAVVGQKIPPGGSLQTKVPITIDRSMRKMYDLLVVSTAQLPEGGECIATEFISLTFGSQLQTIFGDNKGNSYYTSTFP